MEMLYKGQTFERTLRPVAYRAPYSVNWRYQVPGATGDISVPAMNYRQPRAVNWRFSTPVED